MTAKEKAKELVEKFCTPFGSPKDLEDAKACARICVEEILTVVANDPAGVDWKAHNHWQTVLTEIENI